MSATAWSIAAESCAVEGAELEWGVKESFRAYIDGAIANGEWTVAGDVSYVTPVFTWAGGSGTVDAETGVGSVGFSGQVEFIGHGGVLDTVLADPRVEVDGGDAQLVLDVVGTTQAGDEVDATAVDFATLDLSAAEWTSEGGRVVIDGIPASLTDNGATAFGTYASGEQLDPVRLTLELEGCSDGGEQLRSAVATSTPAWSQPLGVALFLVVLLGLLSAALVRSARQR